MAFPAVLRRALHRVLIAALLMPAAGAGADGGSGPGIGDRMPGPIAVTAVRERVPSLREPGTTYVVVFFRSSDAASRQALPVLATIAQRFGKKVPVVAISDEPVTILRGFVESPEWSPRLAFAIAADPVRNAVQTVFGPGALPVFPQAFVLRDGVVQWRGLPMDLEPVVAEVAAGNWDLQSAKRAEEQQRLWDGLMSKVDAFARGGDVDGALKALDEACASAMPAQRSACAGRRFSLLVDARRIPEAISVGEEIVRKPANEKQPAGIAWTICNAVPGDPAALAFALRAAEASDRALKGRDPMVGAILARVQWLSGRRSDAAATARRALSLADSPDLQRALREDLAVYEPAGR